MWRDFAVTVRGLAGALTGLLCVAVSINSETLARSRSLGSRAAQTLMLFMTPAISAIVLAAPQPWTAVGAEPLAVSGTTAMALVIFDRAGRARSPQRRRPVHREGIPNTVTAVLAGIARLTLLPKLAACGLYWMIPAVLASLVGGVINAWLFLLKVPSQRTTPWPATNHAHTETQLAPTVRGHAKIPPPRPASPRRPSALLCRDEARRAQGV